MNWNNGQIAEDQAYVAYKTSGQLSPQKVHREEAAGDSQNEIIKKKS